MASPLASAPAPQGQQPHSTNTASNHNSDSSKANTTSAPSEKRAGSLRVRRPPKRLLSPPPPPPPSTRTSSPKHANTSSHVATAASLPSSSHINDSSSGSRSKVASSSKSTSKSRATDSPSPAEDSQAESTGVGKRKRKPSTMARPPATITTAPVASPPAPSSTTSASAPTKIKVSLGSDSSPATAAASSATSAPSKTKIKIRHSAGPSCRQQTDTGYESDGGKIPVSHAEPDGDAEAEQMYSGDFEGIEPPPLIFQRGRLSSVRKTCSTTKTRGGRSSNCSAVKSSHNILIGAHLRNHQSHTPSRKSVHSRTKSMPSMGAMAGSIPLKQSSAEIDGGSTSLFLQKRSLEEESERDEDEEEDDDEEDFHRAMLDGGFDALDDWPSARDERNVTEIDTPATTPRSPQSACDALTEAGVEEHKSAREEGKLKDAPDSDNHARDAVFSHALAPSSRRVKTHAGLLTLSLPYDEASTVTVGYATPTRGDSHRQAGPMSRFATPTLERSLSATQLLLQSAQRDHSGTDGEMRSADIKMPENLEPSTSPLMSPTHAFLSLAASSRASGLPGTTSMASSPFLAAVGHSSLSRAASPDAVPAFSLPASITPVVAVDRLGLDPGQGSLAASPASTRHDLPDVSPFPAASPIVDLNDDGDRIYSREQSSSETSDAAYLDGSSPITTYSPAGESGGDCTEDDPVFGLPETMDLNDIDVAYGGSGKSIATPSKATLMSTTIEPSTPSAAESALLKADKRSYDESFGEEEKDSEGVFDARDEESHSSPLKMRRSPSQRSRRAPPRSGIDDSTKKTVPVTNTSRTSPKSTTDGKTSVATPSDKKRTTRATVTALSPSPTSIRSTRRRTAAVK